MSISSKAGGKKGIRGSGSTYMLARSKLKGSSIKITFGRRLSKSKLFALKKCLTIRIPPESKNQCATDGYYKPSPQCKAGLQRFRATNSPGTTLSRNISPPVSRTPESLRNKTDHDFFGKMAVDADRHSKDGKLLQGSEKVDELNARLMELSL
jgi:hypothetical protein